MGKLLVRMCKYNETTIVKHTQLHFQTRVEDVANSHTHTHIQTMCVCVRVDGFQRVCESANTL